MGTLKCTGRASLSETSLLYAVHRINQVKSSDIDQCHKRVQLRREFTSLMLYDAALPSFSSVGNCTCVTVKLLKLVL